VGAGDIASCSSAGDEATAVIVDRVAGLVVTLGDNVYEDGTADEFAACYGPSWGTFRDRTRPAPGNHDYNTADGAAYFAYFGAAAGRRGEGWYAYDVGTWRVYVINSNCDAVGGCQAGSAQQTWLEGDLATHRRACVAAYWHHPLFSSGQHGGSAFMQPIFATLHDAGAEIVLSGHDHDYERFAPQDPAGRPDPGAGIRAFVVGTGGKELRGFDAAPLATTEVRDASTHGVLELSLGDASYRWRFVPAEGGSFSDAGTGTCH
jgi:hypothetical protein